MLTQPLHSRAHYNLAKRQQDYRYDERRKIIENAKQQHPRQQVFPVHLPQADQHRGIEHAEPARRMAGKAKQSRGDKDDRHDDEAEIGLIRHQHVHRQRAKAEIDNSDRDLQQRQRAARQHHGPGPAADPSRLRPDPGHIGQQPENDERMRRRGSARAEADRSLLLLPDDRRSQVPARRHCRARTSGRPGSRFWRRRSRSDPRRNRCGSARRRR